MLWAAFLLFCSTAVAGNINAGAFNITAFNSTAFPATVNANIGNICAVQTDTGDTRLIVPGPFATTTSSHTLVVSLAGVNVLPGTPLACFAVGPFTLQGYYYLAPDYTISELYWNGQVNWGTGSACPDCIQNYGFIASKENTAMYAMTTANARRVGFISQDQNTIVEADRAASALRAAICLGTTPTSGSLIMVGHRLDPAPFGERIPPPVGQTATSGTIIIINKFAVYAVNDGSVTNPAGFLGAIEIDTASGECNRTSGAFVIAAPLGGVRTGLMMSAIPSHHSQRRPRIPRTRRTLDDVFARARHHQKAFETTKYRGGAPTRVDGTKLRTNQDCVVALSGWKNVGHSIGSPKLVKKTDLFMIDVDEIQNMKICEKIREAGQLLQKSGSPEGLTARHSTPRSKAKSCPNHGTITTRGHDGGIVRREMQVSQKRMNFLAPKMLPGDPSFGFGEAQLGYSEENRYSLMEDLRSFMVQARRKQPSEHKFAGTHQEHAISSRPAARFLAVFATANGWLLVFLGEQGPGTVAHECTAPILWDAVPSSWLPQSAQQLRRTPPRWYDASGQLQWDDFISSSWSAPAYFSSTIDSSGSEFSSDSIFILVSVGANAQTFPSDSLSNSRFTSAAPSSIPDDDDWSSRYPRARKKLTGHEWVERSLREFTDSERYPKDHKQYLEYLKFQAQAS
ncbi:hypothetical protein B0H19DRAFT_1080967 [Mycena capillaripes]|nr:hypothetical protein B0H19DRAFT_1080967 [Mycena capillaripes]